jgi:hypothetical protein
VEVPLLTIDFWDVGQADCTTIRLPSGKLIIIDGGRMGSPLVDWLESKRGRGVDIEAIVLTHNDEDHAGALPSIVQSKQDRIGKILMLQDRELSSAQFQKIFRSVKEGEKRGWFEVLHAVKGQTVWADSEGNIALRIIHPGFVGNVEAKSPNAASAVIVLEAGERRLIAWPGDLELRETGRILSSNPAYLLVGPHHGGPSDFPSKSVRKSLAAQARNTRRAEVKSAVRNLAPNKSWISVGTTNHHEHPRPGYLDLLASTGCRVVCSQITRCCDPGTVKTGRPVFNGSGVYGLPAARSGVSCRGTFRVFVTRAGELLTDEYDLVHLDRVQQLRRPRCLRGAGVKPGQPLPIDLTRD